jgi:alpha-glucosidase
MSRYTKVLAIFMVIMLFTAATPARAQKPNASGHEWWKHSVFYELYPRSFADSNNDGIGDMKGIESKLGYLHDLGVDAIWISPCFPSPQVDFGYDVSDYENIDPMYGTLRDFDSMSAEAKKKNIRIILDFVVNHSSDKHAWFIESSSSKTNPKRDWYIWRDGKNGGPPNNWVSLFGGPAWKLDPRTGQYYYHFFYAEQPDLNWRNPDVAKAMYDVNRFWYQRGVSGFRLDAVDTLFEDPDLKDNPVREGKNAYGDPNTEHKYNDKLPEVHDVMRGLRKVADEHGAVLIGETWTEDIAELKQYYGAKDDELQLPMNFLFTEVNKVSAPAFRSQIASAESTGEWPVWVISNHDIVRSYNRYGDGQHNDAIAKLIAGMYLTLRGTPIMYYGEELGMENNTPTRKEDVQDPIGQRGWPEEKGRDGERTPMQWADAPNAGFSTAKPWLPVPPSYKTHNVATESKDPDSVLSFYKQVLGLRHKNEALTEGSYIALNNSDANVLAYLRKYEGKAVLVVLNMSGAAQESNLDLAAQGLSNEKVHDLVTTASTAEKGKASLKVSLQPFGVYMGEATK